MSGAETLLRQTRFTMCGTETLFTKAFGADWRSWVFFGGIRTIERGLYYATQDFSTMIQNVGGTWNDTKHRPIVCLIKSTEDEDLYRAIPMGKMNHRNQAQQSRLNFYLSLPNRDIRSCYYHVGRTTAQSIFFISDSIPITDKYIDSVHVGADSKHFIIKNHKLISELERKLFRILSLENSRKNSFRQHITDVKSYLLAELHPKQDEQTKTKDDAVPEETYTSGNPGEMPV
ncbi:MAG: hypothetical protein Q4A32_01300 [Lachnospiraceae bacterium]|nr:hypothetical protein [Lachnospiraceae bacterium]